MQDENTNVFIEFQVIKNSNLNSLYQELDLLIAAGKRIYLWSKDITPLEMSIFAKQLDIPIPEEELTLHKSAWELKSYE